MSSESLDRFRVALKFSLWTWALYWPGVGVLLLLGGLDPLSIVVVAACMAGFAVVLRSGALDTSSSRNMKQFLLERPMYLVAVLVILTFAAPLFGFLENAGMILFSTTYLAGIVLAAVRLRQHMIEEDKGLFKSGADQAFILFGLMIIAGGLVFLDAWLGLVGGQVGNPAPTVLVANWLNLLYPPLLLVAVRPFREPLRWRKARDEPVPDVPPADA